jgi:hypothetical protein
MRKKKIIHITKTKVLDKVLKKEKKVFYIGRGEVWIPKEGRINAENWMQGFCL